MSANLITRIIPVLKVNNRNLNQAFYENILGMKPLLEEAAQLSLGDGTKEEKLILEESPGNRSRRVKGPKKLARIVIRAAEPQEIEALLARQKEQVQLLKGTKGYAFEAESPEGDRILLHAEEDLTSLAPVEEWPDFQEQPDFKGLSRFDLDQLALRVPDPAAAGDFYSQVSNALDFLDLEAAEGADLEADNGKTWDLVMLKAKVNRLDTGALRPVFAGRELFVPKSDKFLLSQDPSKIELWFEA